jgi:hypothetical protein
MAGANYGAFANGRWYMSKNIQEMAGWLRFKLKGNGQREWAYYPLTIKGGEKNEFCRRIKGCKG